ncbi:MAG: GGDEF domain-containing protein [Desulfobacter sp.]|nr:GGDEF domain-containing protein [Desulfobacter sp.]WDP84725.1 MAG: GGDEF domain-containing protein [Desulfobacter sp.]
MNQTLNKLSNTVTAFFSLIFSSSIQRAAAQNNLTRHILALNQKSSSKEIINEVALCLKDLLGYRLFAFVVKKEAGLDVWLDPRMYKTSIEDIILKDFSIKNPSDLNYLNHEFEQDECQEKFSLNTLVHYDLKEENCFSRLYMMPKKGMTSFQDEVIRLILQGCAAALSKQIKIENLKDAAVIDPLTGCYNRREFENQLKGHVSSATRHNNPLSLFMLDLDHFKSVNDTHGHLGGDQVLKEVSLLIRQGMRKGDVLARYGGEEFIAILPETDKAKAMELADRLRCKIAGLRIPFNGASIRITASFGVSQLEANTDISRLIEDADTMLYKAKVNGRNTVMPGLIKVCEPKTAEPWTRDCFLN